MQPETAHRGAQVIALHAHQLAKAAADASRDAVDYVNAVNTVCRYALAIERAELPVLVLPPAGYTDFVDAYANAKLRAANWTSNVVATVKVVPRALVDFGETASASFAVIQASLEKLRADPSDTAARTAAVAAAARVRDVGAASAAAVTAVDRWIADYVAHLHSDAARLNALRGRITQATAADMREVARLVAVSASLRELVADRNRLSTLNSFSTLTLNVFLAVVGTVVGLPFSVTVGAVVGGTVGVTAAAVTTFVPVHPDLEYQESLSIIQKDMDAISAEVGLVNTTVAELAMLASALDDLVAQGGAVRAQVSKVLHFWEQQREQLAAMVADLDRLLAGLDTPDAPSFDAAMRALREARTAWDQIAAALGEIRNVTYTVNARTVLAASVPASGKRAAD